MTIMEEFMKRFTLIELLVVIAIISVLVSILLPVLGKSKEAGRLAVCVSNISQINKGLQMYLTKNNYFFPRGPGYERDTWPSYLDPFVGGSAFTGPSTKKKVGMSGIWASCPNGVRKNN